MKCNEYYDFLKKNSQQNIHEDYRKFMQYQKIVWKVLTEFVRICDKKGVEYQLAYGSLLGAIRDYGQIPWDYDIDVFVPYDNRKKLISALSEELSDDYYFDSIETNNYYKSHIIRVAPKGFDSEALHVDIFFLIGTSDDDADQKKHAKAIKNIYLMRYDHLFNPFAIWGGHFKLLLRLLIRKIKALHVDLETQKKIFASECNKYDIRKSNFCIEADRFSELYVFPTTILETIPYEINGLVVKIPRNYHEILTIEYGEYMEIPPVKNTVEEFKKHLKHLKKSNPLS